MSDASTYRNRQLWGRFALALASARAETYPRKSCGRRGECLARMMPGFNIHKERGDCPTMSEAEWRAVGHGMYGSFVLLGPWCQARNAAEEEAEKKLSPAERERRRREKDAAQRRARQEKERGGESYAIVLWREANGDVLTLPRSIAAAGESYIAEQLARGCRCAKARRLECEDEAECRRRIGGSGE